jgi:hypothetical protein
MLPRFLSAATIGFLVPISCGCLRAGTPSTHWVNKLTRWALTLLLALHHVNSRNASIVGNETLSRIPENFKISFKMKNSDFGPTVSAEALTSWTTSHRFMNDACHLLKQHNLTVGSMAGITAEILDRCKRVETECQSTALYEASYREDIHAVVGVPSSKSSMIVSTIANLHKLPVMSFGAGDNVLTMGSYPRFSRVNVRMRTLMVAIVGVVKHFRWDAINVLNVGTSRATDFASELVAVASVHNITVTSRHVFNVMDTDSIAQAVKALSWSMCNSSALSRTRVTVLMSGDMKNLPLVLDAADKAKIVGAGFVWLNVDEVGLKEIIDTSDLLSSFATRRIFAGFLNM